jgi:hypothetical protein
MTDKEMYQLIADELKTKNVDVALWTQAKETSLGDPDKTEAIYIRLRFLDLVKSSRFPQKSTSLVVGQNTSVGVLSKTGELSLIRAELAKKLLDNNKHSLYSIFKLHPDASEAAIAAAIGDYESGNREDSGISQAEFKYAKDILGDPDLREQYDRQLFESTTDMTALAVRPRAFERDEYEYSWWESSKTSIVIGVASFALAGYLGINYLKERNNSEMQKMVVESHKEVLHAISNAAQMSTQADVDLRYQESRRVAERQNQEMALRNSTADQMREEQRLKNEERMQAEQERKQAQQDREEKLLKAQQDREENSRALKEERYWKCMNMQLSQRDATSYDASAKCGRYR